MYDYYARDDPTLEERKLTGVVKQDAQEKKYLQLVSHEEHSAKSFELIVPDEQGTLTKV